jgi:protein phosphatase
MPELVWGAASDTGRVRSNNEDNLFVSDRLFVVADGMGGHRGGEVASQIAVAALRANFSDQTVDGLIEAVRRANDAVFTQATDDPDLRGMGTTLVALAPIDEDEDDDTALAVVNVGDSRMYLFRDGELERVTEDHSLVEEMVRDGRISPDEALTHPRRNIVTRALGIDTTVEVDGYPVVPYRGDRFVLCSDGLYDEVDDARIAATLRRFADPGDAANELVRLANDSGGHDNISVIVVDVVDDGGQAEKASTALARERRTTTSSAEQDLAGFTAPQSEAPAAAAAVEPKPEPKPPRPRRFTWRVAVFIVLVVVVLAGAATAVGWYARKSYYVGFDGDQVTIFKGRQGGLLWFDPTVEEHTVIVRADVPPARLRQLEDGNEVASLAAAHRYLDNLQEQIDELHPSTTTTSTTITRTTSTTSSTSTTTAAPPP